MPKNEDDKEFDWEYRIKIEEGSMTPQMRMVCWVLAAAAIVFGGLCGWVLFGWMLGG